MYTYYLFDLDGTLTDSGEGIIHSVQYALQRLGVQVESPKALYSFIGPPLTESFKTFYGFTEEQAAQGVQYYREYYREKGIFENKLYDQIPEVLEGLKAKGKKIALATSKPETFAVTILEYFGIESYFDYIGGATLDGRISAKKDVIAQVIKALEIKNKQTILMIGDRSQDVQGAKANAIDVLGVLYGYGSQEELITAGATYIVKTPEQILAYS